MRFDKEVDSKATTVGTDCDAFLAMWDAEGHFLWHFTWGTEVKDTDEVVWSLAAGPDGLIVAAGGDYSDIGEVKANYAQAFVKGFLPTPAGPNFVFERTLLPGGDGARSSFNHVQVSPCGAVVVAGYGLGATQWDTGDFLGEGEWGGEDILVAKLHDGLPVWGHRFGSAADGERATALAVDASEYIYLGSSYRGEVKVTDGTVWPSPTKMGCDLAGRSCGSRPDLPFRAARPGGRPGSAGASMAAGVWRRAAPAPADRASSVVCSRSSRSSSEDIRRRCPAPLTTP